MVVGKLGGKVVATAFRGMKPKDQQPPHRCELFLFPQILINFILRIFVADIDRDFAAC
jgi:hypothetical protein